MLRKLCALAVAALFLSSAAHVGAQNIKFDTNKSVGITGAGLGCSGDSAAACAEPSGASGNGVIFLSANWRVAFSTDGGSTFKILDPTTIFPNDAVGFCCDQIIQYAPSIDRFIWLLQGTGYHLATASPADIKNSNGTAWTYWNLTPSLFGKCTGPDYPDLSIGDNSLYISWDAGGGTGCNAGFQVVRTSLASIQAGGTITLEFTDPANAPSSKIWGEHLTQNTGDEIFWAGHNGNTKLTVYSLKEGSNTYFWRDVGISSWANNAPTSTTPDNQDWLAKNFGFVLVSVMWIPASCKSRSISAVETSKKTSPCDPSMRLHWVALPSILLGRLPPFSS